MGNNNRLIGEYQGQSPTLILKINILQKRDDVLDALTNYYHYNSKNKKNRHTYSNIKKDLISKFKMLIIELEPSFNRLQQPTIRSAFNTVGIEHNIDKKFNGEVGKRKFLLLLRELYNSDDPENIILAFRVINIILDKKGLLKWDTRKNIDTLSLEDENIANHC